MFKFKSSRGDLKSYGVMFYRLWYMEATLAHRFTYLRYNGTETAIKLVMATTVVKS